MSSVGPSYHDAPKRFSCVLTEILLIWLALVKLEAFSLQNG